MISGDREDLRILDLAMRFRAAIEACDLKTLPITFHEFPRGSCGDATLILANYLKDNGQEGFVYVCGMRDGHSHAWLQRDCLIVDITGDQFPDNDERVCVIRGSVWHAQFEMTARTYPISASMTTSRGSTWVPPTRGYCYICRRMTTRRLDQTASRTKPRPSSG